MDNLDYGPQLNFCDLEQMMLPTQDAQRPSENPFVPSPSTALANNSGITMDVEIGKAPSSGYDNSEMYAQQESSMHNSFVHPSPLNFSIGYNQPSAAYSQPPAEETVRYQLHEQDMKITPSGSVPDVVQLSTEHQNLFASQRFGGLGPNVQVPAYSLDTIKDPHQANMYQATANTSATPVTDTVMQDQLHNFAETVEDSFPPASSTANFVPSGNLAAAESLQMYQNVEEPAVAGPSNWQQQVMPPPPPPMTTATRHLGSELELFDQPSNITPGGPIYPAAVDSAVHPQYHSHTVPRTPSVYHPSPPAQSGVSIIDFGSAAANDARAISGELSASSVSSGSASGNMLVPSSGLGNEGNPIVIGDDRASSSSSDEAPDDQPVQRIDKGKGRAVEFTMPPPPPRRLLPAPPGQSVDKGKGRAIEFAPPAPPEHDRSASAHGRRGEPIHELTQRIANFLVFELYDKSVRQSSFWRREQWVDELLALTRQQLIARYINHPRRLFFYPDGKEQDLAAEQRRHEEFVRQEELEAEQRRAAKAAGNPVPSPLKGKGKKSTKKSGQSKK